VGSRSAEPGALDPASLAAAFSAAFPGEVDGGAVDLGIVRAPGRVNLIGEHTDYNQGLVLPAAIDLEVRIARRHRPDRHVRIALAATGEVGAFDLDRIGRPTGGWLDYVAGTALEMTKAGLPTLGFDGVLASTVPQASGLSSSAALELAAAWALSPASGPGADPLTLARVAQRAENEYVGVQCGLMDQFASASGVAGAAVLLDCRSLEHRAVPIPADLVLVVAHTGMPRTLGTSEYNTRRADCERAVAILAGVEPGVRSLRDVDRAMLARYADRLDPVALRRAEHVVNENDRVTATEAALDSGDLDSLGRLFAASHASLRDLFEVSSPELDALVAVALEVPGVVASRMTGAGFGGCTVSLVRRGAVADVDERIRRGYPVRTGRTARAWAVRAVVGAGFVDA
jgi:galactokinase